MRAVPYAVAVLTALALATPSHALTCPMLTDDTGDGRSTVFPGVESDALDIVSADIASGATTVVVVLRLASLADDPILRAGARWNVAWRIDGVSYAVQADRRPGLNAAYSGKFRGMPTALSVDVPAGTFTWTIDRAELPVLATPGKTFDTLAASTQPFAANADAAWANTTYVDQDTACISAA